MRYDTVSLKSVLQPKGYIRGPFGSALKRGDMLETGVPVYEQQHAIYNSRTFRFFISPAKAIEMNRFAVEENDLIISCSGTVGMVSLIQKNDPKGIISQALLLLRANPKIVDPVFLNYFFKSKEGYNSIISRSSGSVQVNISKREIIENIPIPLPPIDVQKKIAAILSALDEKIAINRVINNNLEQQAFALFDRLFPRTIDGSQTIGDYIIPKRGRNLLSKDAVYGAVPVVAGGLEPSTYHNVANTKAPVLTISASGANAGFINLWLNPVWSSDSSYIDYSMTPNVFFWYILLKGRQTEIFDAQTGSAQPHIYPQHIAAMPIGDLNQESVSQFTTQVAPLFELIGANKDENERLRNIRDTLLPKLMSGEIDVSTVQL